MKNGLKAKTYRSLAWFAVIAWAIVIFAFSAQNADESTVTSDGFMHMILSIFIKDNSVVASLSNSIEFFVRKCAHFTIYLVLGALVYNLVRLYSVSKKILLTVALCCLYAISDEIHQFFIPGRACRLLDVFIDTCGAASGAFVLSFIHKHFRK